MTSLLASDIGFWWLSVLGIIGSALLIVVSIEARACSLLAHTMPRARGRAIAVAFTTILTSCAAGATVIRNPGPPPSYGAQVCVFPETTVYESIAAALARMETPELGFLEPEVIICAMLQAFDGARVRDAWLTTFSARVHELSRGGVRLARADPETFPLRVKGAAAYLVLSRGAVAKRLTIGPYAYPVRFWD